MPDLDLDAVRAGLADGSPRLVVPSVDETADTLTAALRYSECGWFVVPVRRGTKNPGSQLGMGWHTRSSRDPQQIAAWWAGTDEGIALHVGRSGAVVFDVDYPEKLPEELQRAEAEAAPPTQHTREDQRRHLVFAVPPGRRLGNSTGDLGTGWGEVRGGNSVIMVAPSEHPNGGRYRWTRTGTVPVLPDYVAEHLPDSGPGENAADPATVEAFSRDHATGDGTASLRGPLTWFRHKVAEGGSRHEAMVTVACWAAREVHAGAYAAADAVAGLREEFVTALVQARLGERLVNPVQARTEFARIWAWAVSQALAEGYPACRARLDRGEPQDGSAADQQMSSWVPVDLTTVLADGYEPPRPTLLPRVDGTCLIYPGKVHALYGEPESGKSWVAQLLAAQALTAGERVLFVDHESGPHDVAGRFLALGVPQERLIDGTLTYVRPDAPRDTAWPKLLDGRYCVAVVDGVNVAMSTEGAGTDSTDDAARWYDTVPRALARRTGAAVVTVDHVTKARDTRGRFAIGSQAKLAAVDGAAFLVRVRTPFGRGQVGTLILRVTKDRDGGVRPHCGPADGNGTQEAARVVLDATDPTAIAVRIEPWSRSAAERDEAREPVAPREDWNDLLRWPLPTDVTGYHGAKKAAIRHVAMFLRTYAVGGIGVDLAGVRDEMKKVPGTDGKPAFDRKTVTRAWGALVDLGRVQLANPSATATTGRSHWQKQPDDPAKRQ